MLPAAELPVVAIYSHTDIGAPLVEYTCIPLLLTPVAKSLASTPGVAPSGKLVNAESFNRNEAENIASYYLLMLRGTRQTQYTQYAAVNHRVLAILRNEYHLK